MTVLSRDVRLRRRPIGAPNPEDFEFGVREVREPQAGEVTVKNLWLSVDPYMRGRMGDGGVQPFELGKVLDGPAIGEVVVSEDPALAPGDLVSSMYGWRERFTAKAKALRKLPKTDQVAPQAFLGVLGLPGFTAYVGLMKFGEPKTGETVFVSGGAGAVGSAVCQIAKIQGCTVIATAGSDAKTDWLVGIGVDHAINYRTESSLAAALGLAAPGGIDLYFDNVGGEHLDAALGAVRQGGRIVECGLISEYNEAAPYPLRNYVNVIRKGLTIRGFNAFAEMKAWPDFEASMMGWIAAGLIRWEETIEQGIDSAPEAFAKLFTGVGTGKMLIRLAT